MAEATTTQATTQIAGSALQDTNPIYTMLLLPTIHAVKRSIAIAKGLTASYGLYLSYDNSKLYTGSFVSSHIPFTIFAGNTNSSAFKGIQMVLRLNLQLVDTPWIMLSGSYLVINFVAISFDNNAFGDKLIPGGGDNKFKFTLKGVDYVVNAPNLTPLKYDIKSHLVSPGTGFGRISTEQFPNILSGFIFGLLGLILITNGVDDFSLNGNGGSFIATNILTQQTAVRLTHFCRITNLKYNASNNPTWYEYDSKAGVYVIRNIDFLDDRTYTAITSIGLYSLNNLLLAIAKLSLPVLKYVDSLLHVKVAILY